MFQFVRRISGSILPRSDRPWSEDATSNAPTIGRKRRLSTAEEDDEGESSAKRVKGEDGAAPEVQETEEVKEVTQGVEEVELEDENPETVPLPASPPPEAQEDEEAKDGNADENDKMAVSPTKSPQSIKSTSTQDPNVSPASAKSAEQPVTTDTSDTLTPSKAPRKTRKLPTKAAKPSSKAAKKVDKTVEAKGKISEEVVELKEDGGDA